MTKVNVNPMNKTAYIATTIAEGLAGIAGTVYGALYDPNLIVPAGLVLADTYYRKRLLEQVEEGQKGNKYDLPWGSGISNIIVPTAEICAGTLIIVTDISS